MKTYKLYSKNLFLLLLILISCVKNNDFEIPDINIIDPNITGLNHHFQFHHKHPLL